MITNRPSIIKTPKTTKKGCYNRKTAIFVYLT